MYLVTRLVNAIFFLMLCSISDVGNVPKILKDEIDVDIFLKFMLCNTWYVVSAQDLHKSWKAWIRYAT